MGDECKSHLIGRAWAILGERRVYLGDRHRKPDGSIVMTWHIPPEDHRGIILLESLDGTLDKESGS